MDSVGRLHLLLALARCSERRVEVPVGEYFSNCGCRLCASSVNAVSVWSVLGWDDLNQETEPQ